MSLAVIFQTLLEGGRDQGWRMWVWGNNHCPVILLHTLNIIWLIAIILKIDCYSKAYKVDVTCISRNRMYLHFSVLTQHLQFCVKVSKNLHFASHMMDLVYIWYDDRYWSKVLFTTIPIPTHYLKVKVTDFSRLKRIFFKNLF